MKSEPALLQLWLWPWPYLSHRVLKSPVVSLQLVLCRVQCASPLANEVLQRIESGLPDSWTVLARLVLRHLLRGAPLRGRPSCLQAPAPHTRADNVLRRLLAEPRRSSKLNAQHAHNSICEASDCSGSIQRGQGLSLYGPGPEHKPGRPARPAAAKTAWEANKEAAGTHPIILA